MSSTLCWNVLSLGGCNTIQAFLLSQHSDFHLQFYMIWKVEGYHYLVEIIIINTHLSNKISFWFTVVNELFSPHGKYIQLFEHSIPNQHHNKHKCTNIASVCFLHFNATLHYKERAKLQANPLRCKWEDFLRLWQDKSVPPGFFSHSSLVEICRRDCFGEPQFSGDQEWLARLRIWLISPLA